MTDVALTTTFLSSVERLNNLDKGRTFDFYIKLQQNPAHPSISMERLARGSDPNLWSGRISQSLRVILHRDGGVLSLLYAGQHDDAYAWAERRRVEQHPITHALQIVETTEVAEQRIAAAPVPPTAPLLFAAYDDDYLLSLGVPADWLHVVRDVRTEQQLDEVLSRLPEEAEEALLALYLGESVTPAAPDADLAPLEHPDTRRRFAVITDDEEVRRLLDQPLAAWITFLHPSQRALAEGRFRGPVKVTGTAGTGKTVVAMHRARNLTRRGWRVLLTTYSKELAAVVERNLRLLCSEAEFARIRVQTVHSLAYAIVNEHDGRPYLAADSEIDGLLKRHRERTNCPATVPTLRAEWDLIIQPQGITTWEQYRRASRAGRGTPLSADERRLWWDVFEGVYAGLKLAKKISYPAMADRAEQIIAPHMLEENARRIQWAARADLLDRDRAGLARAQGRFDRAVEREAERTAAAPSLLSLLPEPAAPAESARNQGIRADLAARRRAYDTELARLAAEDAAARNRRPAWAFDAVIVDEAQDLGPQELRLLATLAGEGADRLTLIGDGGQRIYARKFSLRALGIEVRGRSHTLRVNYRTTEQIRRFADRVVGESGDDLDGGLEPRRNCRSVMQGPDPIWKDFTTQDDEYAYIAGTIRLHQEDGCSLDEIAVLAHTNALLDTIKAALTRHGILARRAGQPAPQDAPAVSLLTMHNAKGREFKVVFVADVADGIIPHVRALQDVTDPQDRDEALTLQRQLLYVSLTRARDQVYITWSGAVSPFLESALLAA